MLLKHLYDYANSRKLLADLAFAPKAVRWIIDLDADGKFLGQGPIGTMNGSVDKYAKEFTCPRILGSKSGGGIAEFLVEGLIGVFGKDPEIEVPMPAKKRKDRDANNRKKQKTFWEQIKIASVETNHPGLLALTKFHERLDEITPKFLRWGKPTDLAKKVEDARKELYEFQKEGSPKKIKKAEEKVKKAELAESEEKSVWCLCTASGVEEKYDTDSFTFRVNGELLIENEKIKEWWRKKYKEKVKLESCADEKGKCPVTEKKCAENCGSERCKLANGLCLVTGHEHPESQSLAIIHNPRIQGLGKSGAALASFDKASFGSYGFGKSLNSPVSEDAATAYCEALNHLLRKEESSLPVGQTTLCFWAVAIQEAGGRFARLLNKPDPQSVASFMKSPWLGLDMELVKKDKFRSVTLAGNSGRVVVRHWMQQTLEQAGENFQKWFTDLEILSIPKPPSKTPKNASATEFHPLSIYWLSRNMISDVQAKKMDKSLASEIPSQLYRAALEGTAPSLSLVKPIINQLYTHLIKDENYKIIYDESRFALLKLILNRNRKNTDMEIKPQLTADTNDAAYNCGRLLAVLAATQAKAHDYQLTTGVAERYFGTATTSPSSVLTLLLRLNRHHLDKIAKSEKWQGDERFLEEQIEEISTKFKPRGEKLPPTFPRNLDLQAQGRFALGFYQQQAQDAAARAEAFVLSYVKKTDEAKYNELVALRENDHEAFSEQLEQHRAAATAAREKKKSDAKKEENATPDLFSTSNQ